MLSNKIIFSIYFICLILVAAYTYTHPAYNPDMLAYMAIAQEIDKDNFIEVHDKVYKQAIKHLPGVNYNNLTELKTYSDPQYFFETIPAHALKPLYNLSVKFLQYTGFNPVQSTLIPGTISFIIIGLLLFKWLNGYFDSLTTSLLSLLLLLTAPFLSTASLSTPDMMAAALFLIGTYLLLEKKLIFLSILVLVFTIYTRIDFMIPSYLMIALLLFQKRISISLFLFITGIFAIIYLSIYFIVMEYEWSPFYFIDYMNNYGRELEAINIGYNHFEALFSGMIHALRKTHLAVFVFIGVIPFAITDQRSWLKWNSDHMIITLLLISMIIRFILHPNFADRFFLGHYILFVIILLKCIYGRIHPLSGHTV